MNDETTHNHALNDDAAAGAAFARLVEIMRVLRSPGGCPWDREQTYASLRPFVLEEAYEVIDAIDRGDMATLEGEVGDLLFEGVFLAQIAADEHAFTITDALRHIERKLVRRHPHVFGASGTGGGERPAVETPGAVVEQWEQIKARERQARGLPDSILAGLPRALPSLLRAYEIGVRVGAVGFDWPAPGDVIAKVDEEMRELHDALDGGAGERVEEELGDLLFSIAQLARKLGIEPESALRRANDKFTRRFGELETRLAHDGRSLHDTSLDAMEDVWRTVKENE